MEDNITLEQTTDQEKSKPETKTYTAEEVEKLMADGRKKAQEEATKHAEETYQKKLHESEKLAKMNEEEKRLYALEQREKAIEAKEKELALAENKAVASNILAEKGISISLVQFVVSEDAETMNANISLLEKEFKKSVKAEVEKRLSGSTPKKDLPLNENMTKERFNKLSLKEMAELERTNPDIFKQF